MDITTRTKQENLLARAAKLEEEAVLLTKLRMDPHGAPRLRGIALGYLEEAIELEDK